MRVVDAAEAVAGIRSGQQVFLHGGAATPSVLLDALVARADELSDVKMLHLHCEGPGPHLAPAMAGHFRHRAFFIGKNARAAIEEGRAEYIPVFLSDIPRLFARDVLPLDAAIVNLSPPDEHGYCSLGTSVDIALPAVRHAKTVIAQLNQRMPYTHGDAVLDTGQIDYAIEADGMLPSPPSRPPSPVSAAIGDRVAALVPAGATLQLGIGAVPDAVLAALTTRHGALRVWSEMFSDGVLALDKAGALDLGHPVIASFAFGSAELYDWMDRNPRVRMLRTETTNDPAQIERRPHMVSVNSALQVDLFAEANACRVHGKIYSGFGGQTDFVVGALHSPGGLAVIALPSWHPKADVSTVVPRLTGPVTSFQHSFIVSDQGTAAIWGHDASGQAEQIITQVAHPRVRGELREAGRALGFRV